jgi:hypothetical protein
VDNNPFQGFIQKCAVISILKVKLTNQSRHQAVSVLGLDLVPGHDVMLVMLCQCTLRFVPVSFHTSSQSSARGAVHVWPHAGLRLARSGSFLHTAGWASGRHCCEALHPTIQRLCCPQNSVAMAPRLLDAASLNARSKVMTSNFRSTT